MYVLRLTQPYNVLVLFYYWICDFKATNSRKILEIHTHYFVKFQQNFPQTVHLKGKGKVVPLQARCGPEGG